MGSYGYDGGGFMSGSQQGSQGGGGGGGGKNYQDETLRPVTIQQVLEAQSLGTDEFTIDGQRVTQITLVGQVVSMNPGQTMLTVRLDDGTGQIDARHFISPDQQDEPAAGVSEGKHIRIFGTCKSMGGKHSVTARIMKPVNNFDEINYHLLEANYVHLYNTKGSLGGAGGGGGAGGDGDSMFVDSGAGGPARAKLDGCSGSARKMYMYLSKAGGNEGQHLQLIANGAGMTVRDVVGAAEELLHQGLIYTTVDDETWAILDY